MSDGEAANETIKFSYDRDRRELPALELGHRHQRYANELRYMPDRWVAWFKDGVKTAAALCGIAAAIASIVIFAFVPALRIPGLWPFVFVALAVGGIVWLIVTYAMPKLHAKYGSVLAESYLGWELEYAKTVSIEIGDVGILAKTETDTVFLTWHHYHCAVVEPSHLVLVFEGSVYALPNEKLPLPPQEIALKINNWAEEVWKDVRNERLKKSMPYIKSRSLAP